MRIIGDYKLVPGKLVTCYDAARGVDTRPYLFIDSAVKDVLSDNVTVAPLKIEASHLVETLVPLDRDDGFLLWFIVASAPRFRLQRHACVNSIVITSGSWGSACIAAIRQDSIASVTFRCKNVVETVTYAEGKTIRVQEAAERI